jgi:hypothetical protein
MAVTMLRASKPGCDQTSRARHRNAAWPREVFNRADLPSEEVVGRMTYRTAQPYAKMNRLVESE